MKKNKNIINFKNLEINRPIFSFSFAKILIEQYLEKLFFYIEQIFENERQKLITKEGYEFYKYFDKTRYRIKSLYPTLDKIIKKTKFKDLLKIFKEKKVFYKKEMKKSNITCPVLDVYISININYIVWYYCYSLVKSLKKKKNRYGIYRRPFNDDVA